MYHASPFFSICNKILPDNRVAKAVSTQLTSKRSCSTTERVVSGVSSSSGGVLGGSSAGGVEGGVGLDVPFHPASLAAIHQKARPFKLQFKGSEGAHSEGERRELSELFAHHSLSQFPPE